jgi:hypothetical protein
LPPHSKELRYAQIRIPRSAFAHSPIHYLSITIYHSLPMPAPAKPKALWRCPECGERFISKNLWHSCGRFTIEQLFSRSEPQVLQLYKAFARMVRSCGRVRTIPQKTRVVFQVRVRFAGCYPRKRHLVCGVALPRLLKNPRVTKIETYAPHFNIHYLLVRSKEDLDAELQEWLKESYQVGSQAQVRAQQLEKSVERH